MLAILFTGSFLGSLYVLYTYVAPLLSDTMGYGRDGVTFVLLMFGLGAVGGNILGGFMADRLGWKTTLTLLCLTQIAIMPVFSFLPLSTLVLATLAFGWALFGWAFMPGQQMRLIALAGPQAPVVLALNAAAIYLGAALGSAIGGLVIAGFGITFLGVAGGLLAILALIHLRLSARFSPAGS